MRTRDAFDYVIETVLWSGIGLILLSAVFGCATTRAISPTPRLAPAETRAGVTVEFLGTPTQTPSQMFVCMFPDPREATCVDYEYFQREYEKRAGQ